jgi:hypothetical protein
MHTREIGHINMSSRIFAVVAFAALLGVFDAAASGIALHLVGATDSPVEKRIAREVQATADMNHRLGSPQIIYVTNEMALLKRFSAAIESRFESDLSAAYQQPLEREEASYLILGKAAEFYVVRLIRIKASLPDGRYVDLPGLLYVFSKSGGAPKSVSPTAF